MLFLPQDVYDARIRLKLDLDAGKTSEEETFQEMLALDPDDYVAMLELGRLRRGAGDLEAAEEYFWRAIQAHPCVAVPYVALAQALLGRPESAALSNALGELGVLKRVLEDENFLAELDFEKVGIRGKALDDFRKLPRISQSRLIVTAMHVDRDDEPEDVTERLRPLRLIQEMQEDGDLDPETVDQILGEGDSMTPLLVGVLRGWAQDLLGEDGDSLVENALALLGEVGSAREIPHLLEFVDLEHEDAAGAATWALGRIIERNPEEAAQLIGEITPGLGPAERLVIAVQIGTHPEFDPAGNLLQRLSENLDSWEKADRDFFFPLLLGAMAVARGKEGLNLGRAALLRQSGLLSRDTRRECNDLLAAFSVEGVERVMPEPSALTVYDICAGDAVWSEDDELDDEFEDDEIDDDLEQDFLPAPEPVLRKTAPGRNDPCWCNSGKKYKKCHLDADQRRDSPTPDKTPLPVSRPNEFEGLRKRIGDFLGQALPKRDFQKALDEIYDGNVEDPDSANITVTDWIIHDWAGSSLGRTVMQEFLVRRGAGLTKREREMVEAWSRSYVGLYEVQELTAGVGFELKDLIFGEKLFVHDVSMSTRLARWDGLLARVVPGERGTELAGIGLTVPRHGIESLRSWMEEDREAAGLDWREYLKKNWPRVRRQSFEIVQNWMESVRLANTDGDELLFSKAIYVLFDEAAAISAVLNCQEFEDDSSEGAVGESFVWLNQKKTVLGHVRLGKKELALECNSRQRLERGKLLLSSIAGESLRHLRDEFTTQKELKSRAAAAGPQSSRLRESEIPKAVRDEAITHFMNEHYGAWPDTSLPVLSGKTPRQAVRTAKGRKQVIAVLKDIENGEDRKRKAGEPFYDVARLRAELGLDS